ncbi:MAG: molybdopterin-dependent oxidoreductase [Bryobacterales bacterium]|nr:molybdopterin-dependent oxidoreductase [Acidobacteriota bacterium]MCB9385761.1 molybdopterin-dependent oxidoreductase [Bryobacterales bacterium]
MSKLTRRGWMAAGLGVAGAAGAGLAASRAGLVPPITSPLYGAGETLTYAAQRLLTRHSLAREFPRSKIAAKPFANRSKTPNEEYERRQAGGFLDWRLEVDGMVANPLSLSLADVRGLKESSQITQLICEEGWSFVAEWTGTPVSALLELAEAAPQTRYVACECIQEGWKDALDMADALHPQTLVTYAMNGGDLPAMHGGPLRLRVPRQMGYKSLKYLTRLTVTDRMPESVGGGDYSWYAGM